jgi:hypothetical protein
MAGGISFEINIDAKVAIAAYHEAGHAVIAAVHGTPLRPEGIMVDTEAHGLACYCKEPRNSDAARECAIITRFAGTFAQERFCKERSYPLLNYFAIIWGEDWTEARGIETKLSAQYLAERGLGGIHDSLERRADELVSQNWPAITLVAEALLAKDWEPVKPLKSGGQWARGVMAKYLIGEEIIKLIDRFGIGPVPVTEF